MNIAENVLALRHRIGKAHRDRREFCARDRRIRTEGAVLIASDHIQTCQHIHSICVPCIFCDIAEAGGDRYILIQQQVREHRRHFGARHAAVWPKAAIRIAVQEDLMVLGVQPICHTRVVRVSNPRLIWVRRWFRTWIWGWVRTWRRCFRPDQHEWRETAGAHMELDAVVQVFNFYLFKLCCRNILFVIAGIFAVTVQTAEMQQREIGILVRPFRIAPVNIGALAGRNPGMAVVGNHQIQILGFVMTGATGCKTVGIQPLARLFLQRVGACGTVSIFNNAVKQQGRNGIIRQFYASIIQGVGSARRRNRHRVAGLNFTSIHTIFIEATC